MNDHLGWLNVYKPINITSFGVLKKIKKNFFLIFFKTPNEVILVGL